MNWGNLCLAIVISSCLALALWLLLKWRDAKRKVKHDRRTDGYLVQIKEMNARTVERRRRLIEQVRLCSPAIKINGKREAAYWNAVLNALAECKPMEEDKLIGIAVLFASLEESFGREIKPDHLEKEARLIAKAERNWRKLLVLIGDPKKLLAAKPQA